MGTNDILIAVDVVTYHVAIAKVFTPDFGMISVLFYAALRHYPFKLSAFVHLILLFISSSFLRFRC